MNQLSNYIFEEMLHGTRSELMWAAGFAIAGLLMLFIPKSWRTIIPTSGRGDSRISIKLAGLGMIGGAVYFGYGAYKERARVIAFRNNAAETCATTTSPDFTTKGRRPSYTYNVGADKFFNYDTRYVNDNEYDLALQPDKKFIVIYNKRDPDECVLDAHRPLADCNSKL